MSLWNSQENAAAFNGLKKGMISGKGVINNRMSNLQMEVLYWQMRSVLIPVVCGIQRLEGNWTRTDSVVILVVSKTLMKK